jgi:hypothetical protein
MRRVEFESCGRSMRWYEWLAALLLLALAAGVRADPVYKCTDAGGGIAYQAVACAPGQRSSSIAIAPAPAYAPPPHYAIQRRSNDASVREKPESRRAPPRETAYECRASDARVFYRLSGCPHSIAADATASGRTANGGGRGGAKRNGGTTQVSARRISRDEACRQIHRAGAIGRNGHEFDETVSTYERDLGNDPCRQ